MNNSKHIPSEKQKQSYRSFTKQSVMNNNQFRISIEQHITNMYNNVLENFYRVAGELNEFPKSHTLKGEYLKYLREKQTLECLLHHIENGSYDSEEFYTKRLNPKTRFK